MSTDEPALRKGTGSGLAIVLIATAIAGAAGYLIQIGVGTVLGPGRDYIAFTTFWATLYLLIGSLSGIQQEVARSAATGTMNPAVPSAASPRKVFAVTAGLAALLIGASSPLWAGPIFGPGVVSAVVFLVAGSVFFIAIAVQNGLLYGAERWRILATSIVADPVLRCILIVLVFALSLGAEWMQFAIVVPLLLTFLLIAAMMRRQRVASGTLDVDIRTLLWNVGRAVLGSAATAILISALPLFLKVSSEGADKTSLATVIFVVTLTRAPIVIPLLALQSFMVVSFSRTSASGRRLTAILLGILAGSIVAGLLAWLLSPWVFGTLLGNRYEIEALFVGLIVAVSGLTAALCATGAAALARNLHGAFSMGWVVAAFATIALLFVPLELHAKVLIALAAGPAIGLVIHLVALALTPQRVNGAVSLG